MESEEIEFNKVIDRTGTDSVKWDGREKFFGRSDILPMWVADMDFQVPEFVLRAMRKKLQHGVLGYTLRSERYDEAITRWFSLRHGWETETDWFKYIPGVMPGLSFAIQAYSQPGDKVVIQPPVYFPFENAIRSNDREVGNNQLVYSPEGYSIDFEDLEKQLAEDHTRLFVLCNPHNPVGRVWSQKELEELGHLCVKHDVLIVSDEIHFDIVYGGHEHLPIASLSSELLEQTITLTSPGKTFNTQGLVTGVAVIANEKLREVYQKVLDRNWIHLENAMSVAAFEAAYRYGEGWVEELVEYLQYNRNFLMEYVHERIPGVQGIEPEGTYIAWLDFRETGMSPKEMKTFLIEEAKVGLSDGRQFGPGGSGFQRINFACPRKTLTKGLERIEEALKNRKS